MKAQLLLAMGVLLVTLMLSCSKQSEPPRQSPIVSNEPQHKMLNLDPHALLSSIRQDLERDPQNASLHGQAASLYDSVDDFESFEREIRPAITPDRETQFDYSM